MLALLYGLEQYQALLDAETGTDTDAEKRNELRLLLADIFNQWVAECNSRWPIVRHMARSTMWLASLDPDNDPILKYASTHCARQHEGKDVTITPAEIIESLMGRARLSVSECRESYPVVRSYAKRLIAKDVTMITTLFQHQAEDVIQVQMELDSAGIDVEDVVALAERLGEKVA